MLFAQTEVYKGELTIILYRGEVIWDCFQFSLQGIGNSSHSAENSRNVLQLNRMGLGLYQRTPMNQNCLQGHLRS